MAHPARLNSLTGRSIGRRPLVYPWKSGETMGTGPNWLVEREAEVFLHSDDHVGPDRCQSQLKSWLMKWCIGKDYFLAGGLETFRLRKSSQVGIPTASTLHPNSPPAVTPSSPLAGARLDNGIRASAIPQENFTESTSRRVRRNFESERCLGSWHHARPRAVLRCPNRSRRLSLL